MSEGPLPLHVETHGPDAGPDIESVLLIHGYGGSKYSWRYWVPHLAQRAHVVLVDMKGFGSALKPDDGRYSPEDQAELVHRLVRERNLGRVTLIGHSLGGGVALLTALRLLDEGEQRLERLVLVAPAAYPQKMPPFVSLARFRRAGLALFRILGPTRIVRRVLRSIVHDPTAITEEQVEEYTRPLRERATQNALVETALQLMPDGIDAVLSRFAELHVPTLLIWGRGDRVVPLWVGQRLVEDLPHATLQIFEECGHMPAEELPHETWATVERFLWGPEEQRAPGKPTVA